jgi:N-dimethylarginine dimethylaminohydrolase
MNAGESSTLNDPFDDFLMVIEPLLRGLLDEGLFRTWHQHQPAEASMSQPFAFLMCRPDFFGVTYVINPWMTGNLNNTSTERASEQWHALVAQIAQRARVELIEPRPQLPDMPFTANAGFVLGDAAIPSRFRCTERQGEERYFEEWFAEHGFRIVPMPKDVAFEGAGDALIDRSAPRVWAGWGHRSAIESHDVVRRGLDVDVVSLRLVDERFYHLDTCFCPLEGGYVMFYPPAFDAQSVETIERLVSAEQRIVVSDEDALNFACNAVNIGTTVIVNSATAALEERLTALGFEVVATGLTEFLKAGGAAKCLTLRLNETLLGAHTALR